MKVSLHSSEAVQISLNLSIFFTDAVPVRDIITVNPPWLDHNTVQQQGPYPCPTTYEKAINLIATQCDKIKSLEETIEKIQTYLKDITEAKAESQKEIENLRAENFNNTAELARVRKELLKLKEAFKESNNSPVVKKQPTKAEKKKIIWEFLSTFFTSAHQNEGDQKLYFHLCKGQNGVFVSTEMTLPDSINAVFIPKTAEDKVDVKEEMECEDDPLEVDRTELVAEENTSMSSIPSEKVVIKEEPLEMSKN
mgnify:CR=1 FL=1